MMTPAELSNKLEQIQGRISICLFAIYQINKILDSGTSNVFLNMKNSLKHDKSCYLRQLDKLKRIHEIYTIEYMDKLELIIKESI